MPRKRLPSPKKPLYDRNYYQRNREAIVADRTQRRREVAEWFSAVKTTFSCVRCGEDDPACLDFHHRDPNEKDEALGRASTHGWSKARILKEISKCVVLCANCHRKLHAGRFTLGELCSSSAHVGSSF